jgi:hypothetical protein
MCKCKEVHSCDDLCESCKSDYLAWLESVEASADADAHLEAIEMGLQKLEDEGSIYGN